MRNVPDIDDKIIKHANENGESFVALVDRMIAEMHKDFDALNILRPDMEQRATHHIAEIIELTEQLIAEGHAYVADRRRRDVRRPDRSNFWRAVASDLDQLQAGARVDVVDDKTQPNGLHFSVEVSKEGEPAGRLRGARVVLAGTLNIRRSTADSWVTALISTAAVQT
ncbi:hypothetical protein ACVXG9_23670 [Escherichia coli]